MELISVIVPVYGVEKYLNKCVESIVSQNYKNLEIILVDDGSPDNCPAICDEWAKKDARIKVIHKINGGLSDARNAGMAIATGEYISFVDSDDWVENEFIEGLYNSIKNNDSDISACGVRMVWEDETPSRNLTPEGSCVLDNVSAMAALINESSLKQPVWYKLYKTELIQDILFPKSKCHEDVFWSYQAIAKAKRVSVFDALYYNYLQRDGSIMGEGYSLKRLDAVEASEQRCRFITENYAVLASKCQMQFTGICLYHSQRIITSNIENKKKHICDLRNRAKSAGNQWVKDSNISKKSKLWNRLFLVFPILTCRIRNLLKIGI